MCISLVSNQIVEQAWEQKIRGCAAVGLLLTRVPSLSKNASNLHASEKHVLPGFQFYYCPPHRALKPSTPAYALQAVPAALRKTVAGYFPRHPTPTNPKPTSELWLGTSLVTQPQPTQSLILYRLLLLNPDHREHDEGSTEEPRCVEKYPRKHGQRGKQNQEPT